MAKYLTPAVTPLYRGDIDYDSCKKLYDHLIDGGVDGILILGSIGEFFALTLEQKKKLAKFAYEYINGRCKLIVGTTSMIYNEIVEFSNYCYSIGIESVMIIPPFYFHFNDDEIFKYYYELNLDLNGQFYLYNFPDRCGYEISVDVIERLVKNCPKIIGIKDTIPGMEHTKEIIDRIKPINPFFEVYSGFDNNFLDNALAGGDGCIAGLSNIYPNLTSSLVKAFNEKNIECAKTLQTKINKLMPIYNVGKPFVPYIKGALNIKKIIRCVDATFPMPMVETITFEKIRIIMEEYENEA